jgi:signal transduction histidine kinase
LRLVILADLRRALREEERQAWKRIIRVLSHEINNSLAPIKSIAGSLQSLIRRRPLPAELDEDMETGLKVISGRAESLGRFMASYAQLARLPEPRPSDVDVNALVRRSVAIETRVEVGVKSGPELIIKADADQLEQLLINLLRNAVDAALETDGRVELSWSTGGDQFQMVVTDEGPGLPTDTGNLFVPFYTTKPGGSGIGLALCLQIAEGHGGTLTLENAATGRGVRACLTLPLEVGRSTAPRTQKRGRLS